MKPSDWKIFHLKNNGNSKAAFLLEKKMPWRKKTGIKTLTPTFKKLINIMRDVGAVAIGSSEMPFCILSNENRKGFGHELKKIYKSRINTDFINCIIKNDKPLVCIWIAGFKPGGDDSRPDRGLVPLVKMIMGRDGYDILSIIYGPVPIKSLKLLKENPQGLMSNNGLWEAILGLSQAVLVDASTSTKLKEIGFKVTPRDNKLEKSDFPKALDIPRFGEHDIDSVLHLLFSSGMDIGIYESMCNPPGGDWSGISLYDFKSKVEYRWTSLPRVSGSTTKRPDHITQFRDSYYLLLIESKETLASLEKNIGPRLNLYVKKLINTQPTAFRKIDNEYWKNPNSKIKLEKFTMLSGAAVLFTSQEVLLKTFKKSNADMVFGMEFKKDGHTTIHILNNQKAILVIKHILKLINRMKDSLSVKLYKI